MIKLSKFLNDLLSKYFVKTFISITFNRGLEVVLKNKIITELLVLLWSATLKTF